MKKLVLFIAFVCLVARAQAQYYETAVLVKMVKGFEQYYNGGAYLAVFKLFSPGLKDALPQDRTISFLSSVKDRAGNIVSHEFVKLEGPYAIYKTTFEKGTWTVRIAIDEEREQINGLYIFPYVDPALPQLEHNTTKLILPFKGQWDVVWSESDKPANYHNNTRNMSKALDMVISGSARKTYKNHGNSNEDYYTFGAELFAPCEGEVVTTVVGEKDKTPNDEDKSGGLGNMLILKTVNNEYLVFAHLKQHSIKVQPGQKIKQGELLGQCGNSGNSAEPHLHFHITNVADQSQATGAKIYFDDIMVNGKPKSHYSPVKGDKLRN